MSNSLANDKSLKKNPDDCLMLGKIFQLSTALLLYCYYTHHWILRCYFWSRTVTFFYNLQQFQQNLQNRLLQQVLSQWAMILQLNQKASDV